MVDSFLDGTVTLHHGDCLTLLACGGEQGHLIFDPPYEDTIHKAKGDGARNVRTDGGTALKALDFASVNTLRAAGIGALMARCSGWFIAFCTPEGIAPWRDAIEDAGASYKRACFWYKPDAAPQFNGQGPGYAVEAFVTAWCGGGVSQWQAGGRNNHFTASTNGPGRHGVHPTEKPLALMGNIIQAFTKPGDLVIDPFMGSGTTGVACVRLGRRFVGIELDPAYYAIAVSRIEAACAQPDFFVERAPRLRQQPMPL